MPDLHTDWQRLVGILKERFGLSGSVNSVLLLIGIQESGKGFRSYSREEKTELILLGQQEVEKLDKAKLSGTTTMNPDRESSVNQMNYQVKLKSLILEYFQQYQSLIS